MSAAVYGEDLDQYGMSWNTVEYTLESDTGTSGYGETGSSMYGDTSFATGYSDDSGRDRYAPGRSYDKLSGYGFLDLFVSYKGGYQPSYPM